jgi:division/cell wall cluster transcriptional repressor MraZ
VATLLQGERDVTLDEKGRIWLPSDLKEALTRAGEATTFVVKIGVNRKPWIYTEQAYKEVLKPGDAEMAPGPDKLKFNLLNFGMANVVTLDKQGRLPIPEKTLKRTKTGETIKQLTLVLNQDHMELWNNAEWEEYCDQLVADSVEISERVKQSEKPAANLATPVAIYAVPAGMQMVPAVAQNGATAGSSMQTSAEPPATKG